MNRQESVKALRAAGKGKQAQELIGRQVDQANAAYRAVNADDTLSDKGRRYRLAITYTQIAAELNRELERMAASVVSTDRDDASSIFGIKGLSGDQASLIISQRDAADRVAAVSEQSELRELLTRATRTGDEVLARAVVERAVRDGDDRTVNLFIADRPDTDVPLNRLWNAQRAESNTLGFNMALMGLKPDELQGMDDEDIAALAQDAPAESQAPATVGASAGGGYWSGGMKLHGDTE